MFSHSIIPRTAARYSNKALLLFVLPLSIYAWHGPPAQQPENQIDEINTEFHFLDGDDILLLHEEERKLKGQIDAYQNEDESDAVLSYAITLGSRRDDHESALQLGVAFAALQCADLLRQGAPGIHFYTLNKSSATRAILAALRAQEPWRDA